MSYVGLLATRKDETYYIQGAYSFKASLWQGNTQYTTTQAKTQVG
jgi:hypothetical protein